MGRFVGALFAYFCVATVLAQAGGLMYAWSQNKINGDKVFRMLAVAHDVDLTAEKANRQTVNPATDNEEMSYEQQSQMKAIVSKNLDLKQQALEKGIENLAFDRNKVQEDWDHYERIKNDFLAKWGQLSGSNQEAGQTQVRLVWEKMKKGQAKDHIMKMHREGRVNDVVILLEGMPNDKRAKIIKDFEKEEEKEVLFEIMDLIQRGDPANALIDNTLSDIRAIEDERN